MLTCLGFVGGFLVACGIGGFIVEFRPIRKRLDRLAHGLPMFWDWSELRK